MDPSCHSVAPLIPCLLLEYDLHFNIDFLNHIGDESHCKPGLDPLPRFNTLCEDFIALYLQYLLNHTPIGLLVPILILIAIIVDLSHSCMAYLGHLFLFFLLLFILKLLL